MSLYAIILFLVITVAALLICLWVIARVCDRLHAEVDDLSYQLRIAEARLQAITGDNWAKAMRWDRKP